MTTDVSTADVGAGELRRFPELFIGGEWVPPHSGRVIASIDPSTEQVWAEVAEADAADVDAAVSAARDALDGPWRTVTPTQRGELLFRLADLVRRDAEVLSNIETSDNGKTLRDTKGEMLRAAAWLAFYGGAADKLRGAQVPVDDHTLAYTRREPVGVVGAILPWNSPISLSSWKLGPALATGNTVVLKPAELTPASALHLARLVQEAGFPPGVVNVVPGFGEVAGAALAAHPGVDKIAFTGEHHTARKIMQAAAGNLKRCSFECGGKSPFIVFDDADLDRVITVALHSAFRSTGQSCSLASRAFVQRAVYEQFANAVAERSERIRVGSPRDPRTHIGPHTSSEQLDKTMSFISSGLEDGFRLLAGGHRPAELDRGYYVRPTVFADVDNRSRLAQEEVFGPVLAVIPFDTEDEAVAMANDTRYGLVGGLFTRDLGRAHRVAAQLRAGLVSVNTFRPIHPSLPYGGFKLSGLGRENGLEVLDEYTEVKSVVIDLSTEPATDPFAG
jgi:(Z)-2-((N-methylformamido)methylene)-5-hydroxybutyrolactone dehydrogenase